MQSVNTWSSLNTTLLVQVVCSLRHIIHTYLAVTSNHWKCGIDVTIHIEKQE